LAQAGFADKENLVNEEFSGKSEAYDGKVELKDGKALLSFGGKGKYDGALVLFKKQLQLPKEKEKLLHLKMKIDGFSENTGKEDFSCSSRIFFTPESAPAMMEPYSNPNVLWLYVEYGNKTASVSLCSKTNQEKGGFGTLLYMTTAETGIFPLEIDLYFNMETYRISFDKPLRADKGNVSGYHKLPPDIWKDSIKFGLRGVNHSDGPVEIQMMLDKISIGIAEKEGK